MAPATNPVALRIIENIETTLAAITEGADYFTTIRDVRVSQGGPWDPDTFPSITVVPLSKRQGGDLIGHETITWSFIAIVAFQEPTDAVDALEKAVHDVHKALMADRQRGGNALDTLWEGSTPAVEPDDEGIMAWVECQFSVQFRTSNTDMTQAA